MATAAFQSADETCDVAQKRFARQAMATVFEVILPWSTVNSQAIADSAFQLIEQLEAQLTVFRPTSEVSRLNRTAWQAPVPVELHLFELLELSLRIHKETHGAFDITSGPLSKVWGFVRRIGRLPNVDELRTAQSLVGFDRVQLDATTKTVRFSHPFMEINLGSIGKGFALDRVASVLQSQFDVTSVLLNGGTSSVLAVGASPYGGGWPIGIKHPWQNRRLGTLRLNKRGMASSGTTYQHFKYNGRKFGHLLDPRSGYPVEGTSLAVAIAATAAEADALATAFFVLGVDGTADYCSQHPLVGAIVLPDDDDSVMTFNLSDVDWTPARPDDFYFEPQSFDE